MKLAKHPPPHLPVVVMIELHYNDHDENHVFHPYCKHRMVVRGLRPKLWQEHGKECELTESQRKLVLEKVLERLKQMEFNIDNVKDWMIKTYFVPEYSLIELDDKLAD